MIAISSPSLLGIIRCCFKYNAHRLCSLMAAIENRAKIDKWCRFPRCKLVLSNEHVNFSADAFAVAQTFCNACGRRRQQCGFRLRRSYCLTFAIASFFPCVRKLHSKNIQFCLNLPGKRGVSRRHVFSLFRIPVRNCALMASIKAFVMVFLLVLLLVLLRTGGGYGPPNIV